MDSMCLAIVLSPGGIIAWLVVGLIAGWLAGLMMKGSGYGILGDMIVGLIGSFLGGLLLSFFVEGAAGFWGSILVALHRCVCADLRAACVQRTEAGLAFVNKSAVRRAPSIRRVLWTGPGGVSRRRFILKIVVPFAAARRETVFSSAVTRALTRRSAREPIHRQFSPSRLPSARDPGRTFERAVPSHWRVARTGPTTRLGRHSARMCSGAGYRGMAVLGRSVMRFESVPCCALLSHCDVLSQLVPANCGRRVRLRFMQVFCDR